MPITWQLKDSNILRSKILILRRILQLIGEIEETEDLHYNLELVTDIKAFAESLAMSAVSYAGRLVI